MSENALNEIHAYFGKLSTTTTKKVNQWAYGQKLIIHDPELPPVFEAYYSNSRSRGTADPQIGTDGVVDAPHAYFRSGADIYVFLMVHEGTDDGRYNKIVHIPIDPCAEPSDVEPEPYEQSVIDQTIAALNAAVAKANVAITHYPHIIEGVWNVWDVTNEEYVSTGVEAQGNGIASARLNQDYTLTLTFTDGTTYTTPSIRGAQGEPGEGGLSIVTNVPMLIINTDADRVAKTAQTVAVSVQVYAGVEAQIVSAFSAQGIASVGAVITHTAVQRLDRKGWNVTYNIPANAKLVDDSGRVKMTATVGGVEYITYVPWTLSKQGETGEQGDTGATPDFTIGTVQTLPAGSQATASITGTDEEPVLNLGLPKGDAGDVSDVQIGGTSIVDAQGVANIPIATSLQEGVVRAFEGYGLFVNENNYIAVATANSQLIKEATNTYRPITPRRANEAVFYGLAKAAEDTSQSASSNAVGNYTENAKSAISTMLNAPVTVTGTTPTIAAKSGIQYICGEVATLDITLPDSGIVDVVFTSGSTPTVLTVTPPTGQTVRWANGFDATSLEADTVYEINILNGLGVAQKWSTS